MSYYTGQSEACYIKHCINNLYLRCDRRFKLILLLFNNENSSPEEQTLCVSSVQSPGKRDIFAFDIMCQKYLVINFITDREKR